MWSNYRSMHYDANDLDLTHQNASPLFLFCFISFFICHQKTKTKQTSKQNKTKRNETKQNKTKQNKSIIEINENFGKKFEN